MLRFIGAITFAFVFSSCSNKSHSILAAFKATEEGLIQSNFAIANSSNFIYKALEAKLTMPESAQQASLWQPKANLVKEKSGEIIKYLDSLVIELKKEAGLKLENMTEVYREDDLDAVSRLFINKNTGENLYEKLKKYKHGILAIDPELNNQFAANAVIITRHFEQTENNSQDFIKTFFDDVPVITALAMLRKFENNVRVLENEFIAYCNNKVRGYSDGYSKIGVFVGQSSNYLKAGEQIEIEAGVGVFSVSCNPVITINGKTFNSGESDGVAKYNFKTPLKPGKYAVPVKIEYTAEDGTRKVITKKINYTVVE